MLTAKSPHVNAPCSGPRLAGGEHDCVSARSPLTVVRYSGELVGIPLLSSTECRSSALPSLSAFGHAGVRAAISHWWFRNEPPNADWKNMSAIA